MFAFYRFLYLLANFMGYDVTRFQTAPDEELICPICSGVLEDAVQVANYLPI